MCNKCHCSESMDEILTGKICPYCGKPTEYVDSSIIYGRSYGMIYLCRDCRAYVGVHKGTDQALGRLANAELREAKKEAHFYFDQIAKTNLINKIWKKHIPNMSNRNKAYLWLSNQCHAYFPNKSHRETLSMLHQKFVPIPNYNLLLQSYCPNRFCLS